MYIQTSISVVIPLYNKEAHIADTLNSVLSQTARPFEVIVVDDGSTDKGVDVVRQFTDVKVIQQANGGVSVARNRGVKEASGDFVAFIDADDFWSPHFLREIHAMIGRFAEADVFTTSYQFEIEDGVRVDPKIRFTKPVNQPRLLDDFFEVGARGALPFMMSSIVVRREAFAKIGLFPVGEPMGEDQDFFCRAALNCHIAYSPRALAVYNESAGNRACVRNVPTEECPFSERLRVVARHTESPRLRAQIYDYCAAHILHLASLNVRSGNNRAARILLGKDLASRRPARKWWWMARSAIA